MKKIAIITLNGYSNYGNRLQNYAVQEVLKSFEFYSETLIVNDKSIKQKTNTSSFKTKVNKLSKKPIKDLSHQIKTNLWNKVHKNEIRKSKQERIEIFKKFTNNYINETEFSISDNDIDRALVDQYEYFIVGSDQVWNPAYISGSSLYFLTFAPKAKRISLSASFGVSTIASEYTEKYKEWISGIHKLSVREDDGAKIIKELTGRDSSVLVDPTFLLTKNKWLSIARAAKNKPKEKYLLTYFLGGISDKDEKKIKILAKSNQLKVINLNRISETETYKTGPNEFIDYINSCTLFCTDSFHGTVFSILMEKPFVVYKRRSNSLSMFSRVNTLLDKFDLNSRKSENVSFENNDVFNIDFSHTPPIIESEREKALNFLKDALNIKS
jgi:exopolysaccharide biosynthesis predicted pyruvyltransferase EpsI